MYKFDETTLRGKIHIKHGFPFKGEYFASNGRYIVLTPGNFEESGGFKFDLDKAKFYTGEVPAEYICARGDLIVAMTEQVEGLLGSAAIVPEDNRFLHNQRIGLITVDDTQIDKMFLYYLLKTKTVRQQLRRSSSGSKVKHTSPDRIYDVVVSLPEVPAQKRIAAVLSALDAKIDLNKRINAELEAMARTLYEYWFVQFDFPDEDGKPYKAGGGKMEWSEKLKREIPKDWKPGELSDIAYIIMGQSPPGESYNESGEGIVFFQGCTDFGNRFPAVRTYTTSPTRFAKAGDILLSVRAPVGALNIANQDCCIGRGLAALRSKDNSNAYLFGVITNLKEIFHRRNVDGTTFGAITKDDLFSLRVIKPGKDILRVYQNAIGPAFEKQNHLESENRRLTELRDWLLPMLMNGQVRARERTDQNALGYPECCAVVPPREKTHSIS